MQRDITDYLEEIMNSGLSKEEKEVLMSALSKKLLQEKERENEQKEIAFKESEVEDDKAMGTDSFKEESSSDREIVSNEVKSDDISNVEHSEKSKSDFDIIDFCKRNNIEPIELGRIMMTPFAKGLSNEQKNILVNYLNDEKIVENIGNYVDNDTTGLDWKFGTTMLESYRNKVGSFSVSDIDDDVLGISVRHMLDVVTNQQHVAHEIFSDEFLEAFAKIGGSFEYKDEYGFDILRRAIGRLDQCYDGGTTTLIGFSDNARMSRAAHSEKIVNCFEDFGVRVCSEDNSTEKEVHTVGNFLEFCKKNDIPRFEVSKIMFAPSYECLDEDELNIVDKLLLVTEQIKDVSQFNSSNLIEASGIIDFNDVFDDYYFQCDREIMFSQSLEKAENSYKIGLRDNKRLCFDTMRMMLSKTFLENYDSLVSDGIRNAISKVSPMKTICDYGSFMDKMKAMYGYRRSLEKRTMTSRDREKLYNETIPNMNAVIDKFDDYEFGYSASSSSSIGAR